jgi:histidinol-phosphate phosphatase family protein
MNRAVFLDRDGTIARDVRYCRRPEDFVLFTNAAKVIKLLNDRGLKVIIITNQSGIARGYFNEEILGNIHQKMLTELGREGARIDGIYYCPHHPDDNCECRKPKPSLILQAAKDFNIDLKHSFVIGDLHKDVELGKNVGCRTILVGALSVANEEGIVPDAVVSNLTAVPDVIFKWESDDRDIMPGSNNE